MITIAIDLRPLLDPCESGVKVYTREMLQAFRTLPCQILPFYTKQKKDVFLEAEWIKTCNSLNILSYPFYQKKWKHQADVLWYPDRRPTLQTKAPQVMTLHDFCPERYKKSLSLKSQIFHQFVSLQQLKKHIDLFISPSQSIQKEAKEWALNTELVLEACPPFHARERAPEKDRFFSILSPDARKGWEDLFLLAQTFPQKSFHIFAGPINDARFKAFSLPPIKNIYIEKDPSQEKKEEHFSKAEAFLSLTHYEGFDLPLLEAQAASCPVLARKIPVHEELYFNEWFDSKEDLLEKMETKSYEFLNLKQELSWEKSAETLLLLLERVVHDKNR